MSYSSVIDKSTTSPERCSKLKSAEQSAGGLLGIDTQKSSVKSSVKILEAIRENNTVTAVELSQQLGLTLRAVEKQLAKLKLEGVLRRVGPDKGGYWEIVKAALERLGQAGGQKAL